MIQRKYPEGEVAQRGDSAISGRLLGVSERDCVSMKIVCTLTDGSGQYCYNPISGAVAAIPKSGAHAGRADRLTSSPLEVFARGISVDNGKYGFDPERLSCA